MSKQLTEKMAKAKVAKLLAIYAKYNHIYTLCPMMAGYGEAGHPDRLLLLGGHLVGIEVKKDANNAHSRPELKAKPNEVMQKRQAERIMNAGGTWVCIHNHNLPVLFGVLEQFADVSLQNFSNADRTAVDKLLAGGE